MAIIHGRVDTKAYKEAMKKNGLLLQSITPREGIIRVFPTVSGQFLAELKASAGLSVLRALGIDSKTLRKLTRPELRTLSRTLGIGIIAVDREIVRQRGHG